MKLTGRTRHRSERRWGKERLILQVECKYTETSHCGGFIDCHPAIGWRDAKTEDLTIIEGITKND